LYDVSDQLDGDLPLLVVDFDLSRLFGSNPKSFPRAWGVSITTLVMCEGFFDLNLVSYGYLAIPTPQCQQQPVNIF
jgi:hypothetical protein